MFTVIQNPNSPIIIRLAKPTDVTVLKELFFEFYSLFNMQQTLSGVVKDLLSVDDPRAFAHDTIQSYFETDEIIYVAEIKSQVVGYISGHVNKKAHYTFSPEAEIVDWFVTTSHRGSGLGKKLLETFLSHIKSPGCKSITLEAFYQNTPTIETYERMGFVRDSLILKKKI